MLFGGYSAGWFYVAGKLEELATQAIARLNRDGTSADCANLVARGFPFRIGLYCDSVRFEDTPQQVAASAAAFRSLAQVYDPVPDRRRTRQPGANIRSRWRRLRRSTGTICAPAPACRWIFPSSSRLEVTSLTADANPTRRRDKRLSAPAAAEAHMRKSGDDLDLAASFTDADIDPKLLNGGDLPPIQGEADLTIKDGVNLVRFGDRSLRGHSGMIRTLARLLGRNGRPFARRAVFGRRRRPGRRRPHGDDPRPEGACRRCWPRRFPSAAAQIRTSFAGLAAMGDNPTLPLKVSKGRAMLGFIPLGNLPPL